MRVSHSKKSLLFTCLISSQSILVWAHGAKCNETATIFEKNYGKLDNYKDQWHHWNRWQGMVSCPKDAYGADTYVRGISVKVENPVQGGGDNTALNGIKIVCASYHADERDAYYSAVKNIL